MNERLMKCLEWNLKITQIWCLYCFHPAGKVAILFERTSKERGLNNV
jgi:hypothetical protein